MDYSAFESCSSFALHPQRYHPLPPQLHSHPAHPPELLHLPARLHPRRLSSAPPRLAAHPDLRRRHPPPRSTGTPLLPEGPPLRPFEMWRLWSPPTGASPCFEVPPRHPAGTELPQQPDSWIHPVFTRFCLRVCFHEPVCGSGRQGGRTISSPIFDQYGTV